MIAIGIVEHPDLRAAAARLDPRPARERLRPRGALGRRAATGRSSRRHILPNAISPVIVAGDARPRDGDHRRAGLGFLGLGPQDPATPEWGTMLTDATVRYLQTAPFLAIFPGLAIVIIVLGFNLIGDGLREALDPKLRGRD